jgi:hypothetical protein
VQEEGLQAVQAYLERVWGEAAVRFRPLAENTTALIRDRAVTSQFGSFRPRIVSQSK